MDIEDKTFFFYEVFHEIRQITEWVMSTHQIQYVKKRENTTKFIRKKPEPIWM